MGGGEAGDERQGGTKDMMARESTSFDPFEEVLACSCLSKYEEIILLRPTLDDSID